jgi:hypothetical protein
VEVTMLLLVVDAAGDFVQELVGENYTWSSR